MPGGGLAVAVTEMTLFAQGPSIHGGTVEIQHNIIGEQVLGVPEGARTRRLASPSETCPATEGISGNAARIRCEGPAAHYTAWQLHEAGNEHR